MLLLQNSLEEKSKETPKGITRNDLQTKFETIPRGCYSGKYGRFLKQTKNIIKNFVKKKSAEEFLQRILENCM